MKHSVFLEPNQHPHKISSRSDTKNFGHFSHGQKILFLTFWQKHPANWGENLNSIILEPNQHALKISSRLDTKYFGHFSSCPKILFLTFDQNHLHDWFEIFHSVILEPAQHPNLISSRSDTKNFRHLGSWPKKKSKFSRHPNHLKLDAGTTCGPESTLRKFQTDRTIPWPTLPGV